MVKQILSFSRGVGGEHAPLQLRHLIDEIVKLAEDTFPRSIEIQSQKWYRRHLYCRSTATPRNSTKFC